MVGKEDVSGSWGQYQVSNDAPKKFWRSASWSSSRTTVYNPDNEDKDSSVDPNGSSGNNGVQPRRFPAPLTPRSQQNCKARSCLPPLQPLAIARRSLDEWPKAGSDDIGEWPGPPTPGGKDASKGRERLKLDMLAIQKLSDKNGGLVKKDRIAFFDKECSKVAEHIYLGGNAVAKDRDILKINGITHVLNCVGFVCPEYFKADFVYKTLWLQDNPTEDITSILYDVFDYFEDVREQKGKVFVHCCQGVSRSTSLVIAYLMWKGGQSFDDAFQYVKEARSIADPNMGFACQLLQCQKRIHAFPLSPSSVLRVYRIAPHSPYDPLHLVPKMLNDPSPLSLDSRGAFIIQVPSAIYIWLGKSCEVIMEREARGAVSQIVRYERVHVPVYVIMDGEEPSFFWDVFSDFIMEKCANGIKHDSSAKIQPGERKLDLYDVDFEIFQKAIKGGFVPPIASSETEHETHLPARENSWSVLRRKFASGHMKEFVSAPKLVVNRLYSDSRQNSCRDSIVSNQSHTSSDVSSVPLPTSSSPSLLSSSSSSPYLSPDSFSSDLSYNSKCLSESSLESPLSLSNLSLLSPKNSSSVSSNHPDYIEVDFTSQPLKSINPPSRRSLVSIAERRGSLSKCLKLPIVATDGRMQHFFQKYYVDKKDDSNMNDVTCFSFELEKGGKIVDCRDVVNRIDYDFDKRATNIDSCNDEYNKRRDVLPGVMGMVPKKYESQQPSIYRVPTLEKISLSGACDLDSSSAVVVVDPTAVASSTEEENVYFWIGKSFKLDWSQVHASRKVGDVELADWNQIGADILSRMGFPEGTNIKIMKEGEEPADFLELLSTS